MGTHKTEEQLAATWLGYDRPADGARFRHYKGGEYVVVASGWLEQSEVPCIIYRSLATNSVWVRTAEDFFSQLDHDGQRLSRFAPM